jgi:hypothetical protein
MAGGNTGNLAFIHAIDSHIRDDKEYFDWDFDPEDINSRFDFVFLICANMINADVDLSHLASRVERLRLPMTAASLGVQGDTDATDFNVSPSCRRFLFCLSEKSTSFGIRGVRAADCLTRLGITNFRIIGCPSNFINPNRSLGQGVLEAATKSPFLNVAAHIDLLTMETHDAVYRKLQELGAGRRAKYFIQSPEGYVELALKVDRNFTPSQLSALKGPLGMQENVDPLSYLQDTLRCYVSTEHWLFDMRNYDCSIGPRLHGNIVAIQAGVPSIIVYHDARTKELAETIAIPCVSVPEFLEVSSLEDVFSKHMHLMTAYDSRRIALAKEYRTMLQDHGVTVCTDLIALSS